ncbi:MAG: OmpA family protein [Chloroflexota bacterium]
MKKQLKIALLALLFVASAYDSNAQARSKVVVSLTGSVIDKVTRKPLGVNLEMYDKDNKKVNRAKSNSVDGYYFFTGLRPGEKYFVRIADLEYLKENIEINVPNTEKYIEYSHDFMITPKKAGLRIKMPVPPFELNKSKLRQGSDGILAEIIAALKLNPTVKFKIVTYPDNNDDATKNATISEERGAALRDYFVSQGIDISRIILSSNDKVDPDSPPPAQKAAKGKRYVGPTYIELAS